MPLYNTTTTALALNIPLKWLDNLLSHHKIPGVHQAKQGIPRRLSPEALEIIAVTHALSQSGLPIPTALELSHTLCTTPESPIALTPFLTLSLDIPLLRRTLSNHLTRAIEIAPTPQRGRPPKRPMRRPG
jgi:hypothetical protein